MTRTDTHTRPGATASTPSRRSRSSRTWGRRLLRDELGVVVVLALLVVAVGIVRPAFLGTGNLLSTAQSSSYVGLMACGMVFPLAMREVDLSVGGNYAFGVVLGAVLMQHGWTPWLAAVALVVACALLGALNGIVTTLIGAPSFIVTLASSLLFRGGALALANGKQIADLPAGSSFFDVVGGDVAGVPTSVWVLVVFAVVLSVVFTMTRFGAQVRAVGSNPAAAVYTGLPIARVRVLALTVSGLAAGVAAALGLAFFIAGDPTIGQGYELSAIAACIIGGTPLMGGKGSVPGALMGSLILSVVATGLVFFHVPINFTTFATGAVILLAVALDAGLRRSRGRATATSTSTSTPAPVTSTEENR
ncbi:ABC transporter permease [Nocardioides mangrovicus]|uniref:Autoinducer 2 import system permease protein LsrC n=1 Tax=Nocardioides mangrovicus TaxID=2478913 RepID=A0A3L8NWS1_9ACTN|nr:ABC transporter permease [Nocardioides mangrovicus]RLV47696.1 ABC transporter permease [Nocardioides mangrovicus]